jgi:broad specificity phosphatase PhoE
MGGRAAGGDDGVSRLRLVLARHGQTDSNVRRALDSRPPGAPLNALGHAQAAALGERLAEEPITAVHASVAIRAQQTAAPVASAHGLDVGVVEGVHEVFCGDLEGRFDVAAREQFELVYRGWWTGDLDARLPGGESAHDLRDRFLPALDRILDGASGDVVLVSHGAAIRLAAAALLGDTAETQYVPNAGLVVLRPDGAGWVLEQWDSAVPVAGDVTAGGAPA